jgi:hypothetical protein
MEKIMKLRQLVISGLLAMSLILGGVSFAIPGDLAPCPSQDVMVDLSSVNPLASWTKFRKGLVSDFFGGSSDALQLAFKEATVEWNPDSCPYSIGWFYGLEIPIGFFDSENDLWRLPTGGE